MPETGEILQGRVVDGKFHLGRYLGGTEHSAVFLTERHGTPRTAAIKLIPANPATADLQLSRWKLISRLNHPHVVRLYEAGRCQQDGEEALYVVMEYAEENLAQILPLRSLTTDEANEMLKPTLDALTYLHGRGFVHGHLKPSNIMVVGEQLKLSSDGICRVGEIEGAETGTYGLPDLAGTAASPVRDIWSLGVTLVQMLTQLLPVREGGQGVTLPETLPAQFADLAHNCLETDPQRRCTLAEIAKHLNYTLPPRTLGPPVVPVTPSVAAQEPIAAKLKKEREEPRREVGKNRAVLPGVAIVALLVATFVGWNLLRRGSSREEPQGQASAAAVAESEVSQPADAEGAIRPSALPPAPLPPLPPARPANKLSAAASRKAAAPSRETATLKTASETRNVTPARVQPRRAPAATSASTPASVPASAPASAPAPAAARASVLAAAPVVPGTVAHQVLPQVSRGSSNTIRGTVRVNLRMRVDPAGNVAGVNMVSAGPSRYFAQLATDAARQWKFSPALRGGQPVASVWDVRFEFIRGGVRAIPVAVP